MEFERSEFDPRRAVFCSNDQRQYCQRRETADQGHDPGQSHTADQGHDPGQSQKHDSVRYDTDKYGMIRQVSLTCAPSLAETRQHNLHDTMGTISTCVRKPTRISLIYLTEA